MRGNSEKKKILTALLGETVLPSRGHFQDLLKKGAMSSQKRKEDGAPQLTNQDHKVSEKELKRKKRLQHG